MQAEEQSEDREEDDVVKVIMPSSNLYTKHFYKAMQNQSSETLENKSSFFVWMVSELKLYNPKIFLYFVLYFYLT